MPERTLVVNVIGDAASLERALGKSAASVKTFGARMDSAGKRIASVGRTLTTHLTLPIAAVGYESTKMALNFQSAMEKIHTQAGASQGEVDRMTKAVLALAPATTQGPQQLADALFHIESVGARGAKALDMLKVAAQGAQVGGANLEDTASALAAVTLTNIKGTENYNHAMGVLNATVGAGNMRMQDLVEALKSGIVPTAKVAGLSLRSLVAPLAMMTDEGVPAGVAANRLRTALIMMDAPSQKAAATLKEIGLNTKTLGDELQKPDGVMVAMQTLRQHIDAFSNDPATRLGLLSTLVGGSRSAGTIAMLMNNLNRVGLKYDQITKTASHFGKDVAASNQTELVKLQKAWSGVETAMIKAGAAIGPVAVRVANAVARVADAFSRLSQSKQDVILVGAGIVAALGPALTVIGNMTRAVGLAAKAFRLLVPAEEAAAAAGAASGATGGAAALGGGVAAEEGGFAGVGAAAAGLGGPLTALAGIVGIVGLAMVKGGGDTDVLSGAFNRGVGAVSSLKGSLDGLKAAQDGVRQATISNTAAQLSVKQAQQNVNQLVKAGQKGTLAYKQAVNEEAQAEENARSASAALALAKQRERAQQQQTTKTTHEAKSAIDTLTASTRKHIQAVDQDASRQLRGQGLLKNYGDAANTTSSIVQNYTKKMEALAAQYDTTAGRVRASNPVLASNLTHLSEVAQAAAEVAHRINAIPTFKQIQIQIVQDYINRYSQGGGGAASGASPTGHPHPHSGGASGSIVVNVHNHGSVIMQRDFETSVRNAIRNLGRKGSIRADVLERRPLVASGS